MGSAKQGLVACSCLVNTLLTTDPYLYQASVILVGSFNVGWAELGRFPFRSAVDEFWPSSMGDGGALGPALGAWLAMIVTYITALAVCYWVVAATRRSWDYLTTTSILHWVLTCAGEWMASRVVPQGFGCPLPAKLRPLNCAFRF
jgi:hypothetical protein